MLVVTLNFFKGYRDKGVIAFVALLTALPQVNVEYASPVNFGVYEYSRALSVTLLLPYYLTGEKEKVTFQEKVLIVFLACLILFDFRADGFSVTVGLRLFLGYFLDWYLPFSVLSRTLRSKEQIRAVLGAIVLGSLIRLLPTLYEFVRQWNLYNLMFVMVGENQELLFRRYRAGFIRVSSAFFSPIVHGYYGGLALIASIYLSRFIDTKYRIPYFATASISVVIAFSKGPWLATAVAFCYLFFSDKKFARGKTISAILLVTVALAMTPVGEKIYGMIPFVGDISQESEDYRELLLQQSLIVFKESPWFGLPSKELYAHPALQVLLQGQGIIDITNYYLQLLLEFGVFVLAVFLLMTISAVSGVRKVIKQFDRIFVYYDDIGSDLDKAKADAISLGHNIIALLMLSSIVLLIISDIDRMLIIHFVIVSIAVSYARTYGRVYKEIVNQKIERGVPQTIET